MIYYLISFLNFLGLEWNERWAGILGQGLCVFTVPAMIIWQMVGRTNVANVDAIGK